MSYKVKFIPKFEKELKRLAKKFPSLKADFALLLTSLKENPTQGTALGHECYKVSPVLGQALCKECRLVTGLAS
ncbi:type II toxin-antitoxin system RelE family toxin [Mucilaginibacter sp. FT3.2]|uniref:type II toxin-antitoxin system RelE family toxin n=1 Tax=Mucilaginibacter sp. FT3.2 TaxID=2723090 RepID=UPI00161948D7|nr:hypothetical protein [Mucilaginibacter sp. FT3.2]MBB6234010.1 mRNA-degrading endonuclease RelE of RelBE toxin-antitoxin system [Mucilaginibacter sp. FT3.2]